MSSVQVAFWYPAVMRTVHYLMDGVLGALMIEQRVVFVGARWGHVSGCAHAATVMLYRRRGSNGRHTVHVCKALLGEDTRGELDRHLGFRTPNLHRCNVL